MSIFNGETSPNEAANPNPVDAITNALMSVTREDGTPKYTDPVDAINALKASQEHIRKIEADNAILRDKATKVENLEETLRRLGEKMETNGKLNPPTGDEGGRSVEAAEELVAKLLDAKLQERDAVKTAISNVETVQKALVAKYGGVDKAKEVIASKATSLGIKPSDLEELSAKNPKLVLELFGSSTATPSPNVGSIHLGSGKPSVEKVEAPERSILSGPGATHKNQMEYFNKIKDQVNKRLNVET